MLIINAKIFTMENDQIEHGFLWIQGSKIMKLGSMSELDIMDSDVLDLKGKSVYPGFIDAHTHLGVFENGLGIEGDDGNEVYDPITPHLRVIDAINPMDFSFREALLSGVTTAVIGPGSSNPIAGQMVAVKTFGRCIDQMVLKDPVGVKFSLGENPKNVYGAKNQIPSTRMTIAALIREQLYRAKRYLESHREPSAEYDLPEYDMKCESLGPLLRREVKAYFHAHRTDDIFTAIRIAKEFNLLYTIIHGTEGHMISSELCSETCSVLCGPILSDRSKPELACLTPKNPGVLSRAGVKVAIVTDHPETPIQYLLLCAGLVIREGMDPMEALRAITTYPAQICGISDRVGSIAPGKDADLVVFDQDPFSCFAVPQFVFCNGILVKSSDQNFG